jgi:N-acetylmuramoyl-L-alanine amidase
MKWAYLPNSIELYKKLSRVATMVRTLVTRLVHTRALHGVLACMLLLLASSWANATALVKDIRLSSGANSNTRVVFAISQPVSSAKVFTLDKPSRVVIDFSDTRLQLASALPSGQGLVKTMRTAPRGAGLRVVLDVTDAVQARSFPVDASDGVDARFVIDLSKATGAAPVASTDAALASRPVPVKSESVDGRELIIAIDAGHGGTDPGASGRRGTQEKNVTLAIARQLKARIDAEPGMRAVLTRDGDYFVPLRERIRLARQYRADMFISIHADSVRDRDITGSSVYTLSPRGATDEAGRWLAERENAADLMGGVSLDGKDTVLASVLLDLSQGASMSASNEAASEILEQLDHVGNVLHSEVQHAGFVVLKSPDIPSMLVETAFISNPLEEQKLGDPRHQERLAEAVRSGVRAYFYGNPPPGTRIAQLRAARQASNATAAKIGAN